MTGKPSHGANPRLIPSHGGYRNLKSFQSAEIVYDATVKFCDWFIDKRYTSYRSYTNRGTWNGSQKTDTGSEA